MTYIVFNNVYLKVPKTEKTQRPTVNSHPFEETFLSVAF